MFVVLDAFDKRVGHPEMSANGVVAELQKRYASEQEGFALVIPPPPVRGIGTAGGFKMQVEDREGKHTPQELQSATDQLMGEARKDPRLRGIFSSFRANVPQLFVDVDRTKVKSQNVQVTDVFQTLQVYLGSLYINDFNFLGRTYRVVAQADAKFRAHASDISELKTRNRAGQMVPLGSVATVTPVTGPDRINRYNLYQSAEINGAGGPGVSTGQALSIMEGLAKANLPRGYGTEWTELSFQEKEAGNTAIFIFPLCILFVFLTHSAEYESFSLSSAIILIVPMCLLCGIGGVWMRHMDNNIFTQIGFVVLAGLSAKNAVLIVEFAKQQQEQGKNAFDAAVEAARLRLRPILMTSFAFILGVVPLITATGAGSEMRQALGTVVFYGMLGVTFFGLFLTPVFYYVIRRLTGKFVLPPEELVHGEPEPVAHADAHREPAESGGGQARQDAPGAPEPEPERPVAAPAVGGILTVPRSPALASGFAAGPGSTFVNEVGRHTSARARTSRRHVWPKARPSARPRRRRTARGSLRSGDGSSLFRCAAAEGRVGAASVRGPAHNPPP